MDDPRHASPSDDSLAGLQAHAARARGLFVAGWYATRDEGRLVHPAEQTELRVSPETWRALRELETRAKPVAPAAA